MFKKVLFLLTLIMLILVPVLSQAAESSEYIDRFLALWDRIHNATDENGVGYFSPEGAPYHSVETLLCEAPDYGHETTSEAYSYWIWLEAMYGRVMGDWSYLQDAWATMEEQIIPIDQDNAGAYDASDPATYAAEWPHPSYYPSELISSVPVGQDPISDELTSTYGDAKVYGMHWLMDCDNFYGYSNKGDDLTPPIYINTFQRGEEESCWETIPQPSYEEFEAGGPNGYLDLFTGDASYSQQWRFTNAPDADARAVQALYWAYKWASEQDLSPEEVLPIEETKKMGDYLRLSMFDKYFKPIGCESESAAGATGRDSAHYLLSWYYAWGGSLSASSAWAWRIGCSHNHFGYQNPVAAWVLSEHPAFIPDSPTAQSDWSTSLQRQLEFYRWLQSAEGAIAGGATNSWNGAYEAYPSGQSTFYGMAYDDNPVYHDPGSNTWFGFQAWSMERVCELYYLTNNELAKEIVEKWANWVKEVVVFENGTYRIPSSIDWSGQPDTWDPENPGDNSNLHVIVNESGYSQDTGIAGCLAKALFYYGAAQARWEGEESMDTEAVEIGKQILDIQWELYLDDLGIGLVETRSDFARFFGPEDEEDEIYVPDGWSGTMPNGDVIEPGITFIDIRSNYKDDPMYDDLVAAVDAGEDFSSVYHRTWAQIDIALANAAYHYLFIEGEPVEQFAPTISITDPLSGDTFNINDEITITADADDIDGTVELVEFFIGAEKIGEDITEPYSIDWTAVSAGNYSITAVATDNDGKSTTSKAASITVYPEGVSGDIKVQYGCLNTDSSTNSMRAKFNITNDGSVSEDLSDMELRYYFTADSSDTLEFHCDYAVMGSGNVDGSFVQIDGNDYYLSITFSSSSIPANGSTGEIQVRFNAVNWANINQANDYSFDSSMTDFAEHKLVTLYKNGNIIWGVPANIENNYPTVSITAPSNGAEFDEGDDITITASASDADGSIAIVEFYVDGTKIGEDASSPYSITMSDADAGDYILTAVATDDLGASTTSTGVSISVEGSTQNVDPTVSITAPADGAEYDEGDDITITATASDTDGSVVLVEFYVDGTKIGEDASSPYSITMSDVAAGDYTITAIATDDLGATASDSVDVTVNDSGSTEDFTVDYSLSNDWGSGFQGSIILTNDSGSAISAWQIDFTFSGDQTVVNSWGGEISQSGQDITVSNMAWNGTLNDGESITIGFIANYSGSNVNPTDFVITVQ